MSHHVIQLGRWVDLSPDQPQQYICRLCRGAVSLGNDSKAISKSDGSYEYEHYEGYCVQCKPAKNGTKKRAGKNEHKG